VKTPTGSPASRASVSQTRPGSPATLFGASQPVTHSRVVALGKAGGDRIPRPRTNGQRGVILAYSNVESSGGKPRSTTTPPDRNPVPSVNFG